MNTVQIFPEANCSQIVNNINVTVRNKWPVRDKRQAFQEVVVKQHFSRAVPVSYSAWKSQEALISFTYGQKICPRWQCTYRCSTIAVIDKTCSLFFCFDICLHCHVVVTGKKVALRQIGCAQKIQVHSLYKRVTLTVVAASTVVDRKVIPRLMKCICFYTSRTEYSSIVITISSKLSTTIEKVLDRPAHVTTQSHENTERCGIGSQIIAVL